MKIYLFYIESHRLPECLLHHYESIPNYMLEESHVLYAYTDDKTIKTQFLLERRSIFTVKKVDISKDEIGELDGFQLKYYSLYDDNGPITVLCTEAEHVACTDLWHESVFNDFPAEYLLEKHLSILKDEYRDALKVLGLDGMLINISEDEPDWCENMEDLPKSWIWEADYWIRPLDSSKAHIEVNIFLECKEYNVFILQFGSLFDV